VNGVSVHPIGEVRTAYSTKSTTPVQSALNPDDAGRVVLATEFRDGLFELDGFDYLWLLTWLTPDPSDPAPVGMRQIPFLLTTDRHPIGLFAMRGPRRPNPIGLHLVRLTRLHDDGFDFAGVDMIDHTPVLDVKPWVAPLDLPFGHRLTTAVRSGWFGTADLSRPHTPASLRDQS
jgi:tRNA-Thr(GGU) m(6)t(6)A37 methyltransferase TsaA